MTTKIFFAFLFRSILVVSIISTLIWVFYEFGAPKIAEYMAPRYIPLTAIEEEAFSQKNIALRKEWFDNFVPDCSQRLDQVNIAQEDRERSCAQVRDEFLRKGIFVPYIKHPSKVHPEKEINPRLELIRNKIIPALVFLLIAVTAILFLRNLCKLLTGIDLIPWLPVKSKKY